MFDPQVRIVAAVIRHRHVACGIDAFDAGAAVLVDHDAAGGVEPSAGQELGVGQHPGRHQQQAAAQLTLVGAYQQPAWIGGHLADRLAGAYGDAGPPVDAGDRRASLVA